MGEAAIIMIWFGIASILGFNGLGAGMAAMLHLWRGQMRSSARIVTAAALSGSLPASVFIPMAFTDREFIGGEGMGAIGVAVVLVLGVAALVSLPGAIVVTRKLGKPGDDYRAFE